MASSGKGDDEDEVDFFEMLGMGTRNRMDEQRSSHVPDAEKPMVINFDLLKNQMAGKALVTDARTTFPCYYMGHEPCHYSHDKEKLCNELVHRKCEASKLAKLSSVKNPFSSHVRCDVEGIHFVLGSSGAATVNIELSQVACVSLCPKKPGGALKIVAILCRSPRARENKKGVGELGMVLHMCRLKNNDAMWNFQRAFVEALKMKFPEFHSKAAKANGNKAPAGSKSSGGDGAVDDTKKAPDDDELEDERDRSPSVILSPVEEIKATKMPRAHRVFVKTQEEAAERDVAMAERLQREEEFALKTQAHTLDADAQLAKELQEAEDAKMARQQSLSFDDVDPLSSMPT
eukprot:m.59933 g.59933  ORF g.59933 m.59933 type:complete len:346 (+) comp9485_c0_seq3:1328-2365(+)